MRRGLAIGGNAGEATGFELGRHDSRGRTTRTHTGLACDEAQLCFSAPNILVAASTFIPPTFLQGSRWRPLCSTFGEVSS